MSAGPGVVNPRGRRWHHAAQAVRMSLDHADATSAPRGARWVRLRRTQRTCLSLTALSSKGSSHHEHRHPYRHTPSHGAGPAHRSPRTCADPAGAAMSVRSLVGVAVAVVAVVVLCAGGIGALFTGGGGGLVCAAPSGSAGPTATISAPPPGGAWPRVGRWDSEQVGYAATIIAAGTRLGVPPRGWVIAVATAMQESDLRNPPGGPDDSIGLFQQRPSQGWGTPAQLADPDYAATKYFQALLKVPGWQTMALTDAAQAVQKSAFPDAYAKWEPEATVLVSAVGSAYWRTIPGDLEQCPVNCPGFVNIDGQSGSDSGCLHGEVVLARAATWLTAWGGGPVPYLSSGDPAVWFRGYRRDCSGYASMALGLAGPGLDGVALAARSMPIRKGAACE